MTTGFSDDKKAPGTAGAPEGTPLPPSVKKYKPELLSRSTNTFSVLSAKLSNTENRAAVPSPSQDTGASYDHTEDDLTEPVLIPLEPESSPEIIPPSEDTAIEPDDAPGDITAAERSAPQDEIAEDEPDEPLPALFGELAGTRRSNQPAPDIQPQEPGDSLPHPDEPIYIHNGFDEYGDDLFALAAMARAYEAQYGEPEDIEEDDVQEPEAEAEPEAPVDDDPVDVDELLEFIEDIEFAGMQPEPFRPVRCASGDDPYNTAFNQPQQGGKPTEFSVDSPFTFEED